MSYSVIHIYQLFRLIFWSLVSFFQARQRCSLNAFVYKTEKKTSLTNMPRYFCYRGGLTIPGFVVENTHVQVNNWHVKPCHSELNHKIKSQNLFVYSSKLCSLEALGSTTQKHLFSKTAGIYINFIVICKKIFGWHKIGTCNNLFQIQLFITNP